MNAIGEYDLELLEDYLDDALSPAQVEHVARRLSEEPELALAMHELRASRTLRSAAWRSMEPTEFGAASVAGHIARVVQRDAWRRRARRSVWISTALAAGVGFFVFGWMTRTPLIEPQAALSRQIAPNGLIKPASLSAQEPRLFHVALIDSNGRLTPAQKFSKADEARQFARDLLRYEDRRREAEQGGAMLVSDHF